MPLLFVKYLQVQSSDESTESTFPPSLQSMEKDRCTFFKRLFECVPEFFSPPHLLHHSITKVEQKAKQKIEVDEAKK